MKKVIFAIILLVFALMDGGAVTRIDVRVDTARGVIVIPAVEGGADVAVAVIDKRIGTPDTLTTIASQLLLQSDLRGHVEDAAWYLRAPALEAVPAADALMLTQGWTRYDIPAAIRGDMADSLAFPIEIGAQLDGVIRSKWRGKPLAGVTTNVLAPRMADGASATTDSLGRFSITGLEWPDSTWLVVSAMNAKGKLEENIHPDFDTFPAIASLPEGESLISTIPTWASDDEGWDDYVARLNASPQGMQISLKEIVVRGTKQRKEENAIDMLASINIRLDENKDVTSYEQAVANIPGVNIIEDRLLYHQTPVAVWVDGRYLGCSEGKERGGTAARSIAPKENAQNPWDNKKSATLKKFEQWQYSANMAKEAVDNNSSYDTGLLTGKLKLIDLEGMYPFLENESVAYVPPHLSMLFPQGAINDGDILSRTNGGILSITTKNPAKITNKLSPEFHPVMPLGYQKPRRYRAAYDVDGEADGQSGTTVAWIPSADLSGETVVPMPPGRTASDMTITIEGISPTGQTIDLRK
ncbi:carboxypeptidase-like regulatory domain-containing protein [uncultured Muribaculum sp.]|uniref:carboxypeptidase-like regulatory domain-containing protein n=1 Tax=uncultured Muribaculum sp. TaxID=1918613 RepID=UPI0025F05A41|nr:carboxypeptidase-like regulatory domain-containing protein [uncultured Muribaculum sp.]